MAMVTAVFLILASRFVRVNHSPSMPKGLWIETGLHTLSRGDIVVVCLEKLEPVERYVAWALSRPARAGAQICRGDLRGHDHAR